MPHQPITTKPKTTSQRVGNQPTLCLVQPIQNCHRKTIHARCKSHTGERGGLFCRLYAVNGEKNLLGFLLGNADRLQCLSGTAVWTDWRLVVHSGNCRSIVVSLMAQRTNPFLLFIRFHKKSPPCCPNMPVPEWCGQIRNCGNQTGRFPSRLLLADPASDFRA